MKKVSTLTTYEEIVELARVYCIINRLKLKDYVATLIKNDLKETAIYRTVKNKQLNSFLK